MPLSEKTVFVAMYVDYGETCDGKARVLGIYPTLDVAIEEIKADMSTWIAAAEEDLGIPRESIKADFDKMTACLPGSDYDAGCEWSIEEQELDPEILA